MKYISRKQDQNFQGFTKLQEKGKKPKETTIPFHRFVMGRFYFRKQSKKK